ncbi:YceD family protein [Allosphingosinicella indica]|uniref:Uncharacterized ACR, COG1399 n=1 Tax=Allosphingosinicella indica TaxID=941907 RepID=A0A1X7G5U9_9SPHN|nr:YceD family protein [Allosphingosinicella indica]SMF64538.1 Uncharacterized ACR, COG1399 [Allosphingosinicella indica]
MTPEFSRPVRLDAIGTTPRRETLTADEGERAALARRFALLALGRLEAEATVARDGDAISVTGRLRAAVEQSCVATGVPVPAVIDEPFALLYRPEPAAGDDEEIELDERELDVVFHDGQAIDLGEAAAETLALALDPWPRAPGAEAALREAGVKGEEDRESEAGPFGALAALKDKLQS